MKARRTSASARSRALRAARPRALACVAAVSSLVTFLGCNGVIDDDRSPASEPAERPAGEDQSEAIDTPAAPVAEGPGGGSGFVADEDLPAPVYGTDTLEGALEVYVTHFNDETATTTYELVSDSGDRKVLDFPQDPLLATGDQVRVLGVDGAPFQVQAFSLLNDDDEGTPSVQALTNNATRQTGKVGALLVYWDAPDSLTTAQLKSNLFTSTTSAAEFHKEISYNLDQLNGDVFGWLKVPAMTNCDTRTLATNAQAAAKAAGIDLSGYGQLAYYFPQTSQCAWSGLAYVGRPKVPAKDSWYNGSSGCGVLAHELGHNIGAQHARSYDCGGSIVTGSASCTYSEYGDPYDVMGGGQCTHPSGYLKSAEGWYGGCNVVTVTANGSFDITPIELPSNALQTVRIPMDASLCPSDLPSCFYYLEFRQPIGKFDNRSTTSLMHQGVLVHVGSSVDFTGNGRPQVPYLLDMTPGSRSSDFQDAPLTVGKTFNDGKGVSITVNSIAASAARVTVSLTGGGSGAPTCIDGKTYTPGGGTTNPTPDAGVPDAGTVVDSGVRDAGTTPVDSGVRDAGTPDAGPVDAGTPDSGTNPGSGCPAGTSAFNGRCYAASAAGASFDNALNACKARGTGWSLAEVSSAAENQFVASLIGTSESWLGASDRAKEGTWKWNSGTTFWAPTWIFFSGPVNGQYTSFVSGEPNDGGGNSDCLRMVGGGGWRDGNCADSLPSVCER